MEIDYNELERRVLKKLDGDPSASFDDEKMEKMYDILRKEIVYISIHVLSEYDKMKEESSQ